MTSHVRDITQYSKDYLADEFEKILVDYRREKVLERLRLNPHKNILEVGCGVKPIFDYCFDYESYTVIEPSKEFCEIVSKSENYNNRIKIINDFVENTAEILKQTEFDFILVSGLIHEVVNPEKLLRVIHSLCSENTIVHINVPNEESFHMLWALESGLIPSLDILSETSKKFQHNSTFNLKKLIGITDKCGFKYIDKGSYFIKIFNNSKMIEALNSDLINDDLMNGLNKMTKYFPDNGAEIFVDCKVK